MQCIRMSLTSSCPQTGVQAENMFENMLKQFLRFVLMVYCKHKGVMCFTGVYFIAIFCQLVEYDIIYIPVGIIQSI